MSLTQPQTDGSPSPALSLNFSSNNPFRNRATSPLRTPNEAPPRPMSRNPFLAAPNSPSTTTDNGVPAPLIGSAAELFDNLTINEPRKSTSTGMRPPPPPPYTATSKKPVVGSRAENIPPRGSTMHRPTRSQEEAMRARRPSGRPSRARAPTGELDIFADPESPKKLAERRTRRNSESSLLDRSGKPLDSGDERRRQERSRRERRHREAGRDPKERKSRKMDIIDQLDATSIYGTGLFHHDGPFDACNPNRNRPGSKRAPMQAFPKDSLNNVIGGGGPVNRRPDHATFLGNNDDEAFKDYATGGAGSGAYEPYVNGPTRVGKGPLPVVESALQRVEPIHGDESLGLGTSTFLEGTPASRAAMQRRESESTVPDAGGLARKKSLAQKIRGINRSRDLPSGRVTSPGGGYTPAPLETATPGGTRIGSAERNPFFQEYDWKEEKLDVRDVKEPESVIVAEPENYGGRARAPSSPRRGFGERLERRVTSDGIEEEQQQLRSGSFMSRVKSLKGGKRRLERPEVEQSI